MRTPPQDAFIDPRLEKEIEALATLYDRFANALDPFAPGLDEAERAFNENVASWHDVLDTPKPNLHEFRKAIIYRCKLRPFKNIQATFNMRRLSL
jgi:hypothetical protein